MRAFELLSEKLSTDPGQADPQTQAVKQNIITQISNITDIDELHQIYSYVRKIDIGGGIDSVLQKDEDLKQVHNIVSRAIIDAKAPFDDKMAFAKELTTKGIINIKALLTPGTWQTLDNVIQTSYPNIYKQVSNELINISGAFKTGKTKTVKGKGEVFLALASPKIMLSKDAGDLVIGNSLIEVKGNGGRLKGVRGYGNSSQTMSAIKKSAATLIEKSGKKVGPVDTVNVGKTSVFWNTFGPNLIAAGVKPASVINFMRTSLTGVLNSIYLDADEGAVANIVNSSISKDGKLIFETFVPALKKFTFDYYQQHDKFKGILFLNGDSGNCIYIQNSDQFVQTMTVQKLGLDPGAQNGMQVKVP